MSLDLQRDAKNEGYLWCRLVDPTVGPGADGLRNGKTLGLTVFMNSWNSTIVGMSLDLLVLVVVCMTVSCKKRATSSFAISRWRTFSSY